MFESITILLTRKIIETLLTFKNTFFKASPNFLLQGIGEPIKLGPKRFGCPFCDSIMKKKDHMRDHIRTHTGYKPFKCSMCSFSSAYKYTLTKHLERIHKANASKVQDLIIFDAK